MNQITANLASHVFCGIPKDESRYLPICPQCKNPYMGDGKSWCVDCESEHQRFISNEMKVHMFPKGAFTKTGSMMEEA
jgi:hypothetical protein